MPFTTSISPLALAARNASGVSASLDLGVSTTAKLRLLATAASGGGSVVVTAETSTDQADWRTVYTWTAINGAAVLNAVIPGCDKYLRISWVITVGSVTFGISGTSVLVYCTPQDIEEQGIPLDSFTEADGSQTPLDKIEAATEASSDEADDTIGDTFTMPLSAWPSSHRGHVARVAIYRLMNRRGYQPSGEGQSARDPVRDGYKDALNYFKMIAENGGGNGFVDQTPLVEEGGAYVITNIRRGWARR